MVLWCCDKDLTNLDFNHDQNLDASEYDSFFPLAWENPKFHCKHPNFIWVSFISWITFSFFSLKGWNSPLHHENPTKLQICSHFWCQENTDCGWEARMKLAMPSEQTAGCSSITIQNEVYSTAQLTTTSQIYTWLLLPWGHPSNWSVQVYHSKDHGTGTKPVH